jgi:acetyl-CoA synthetase
MSQEKVYPPPPAFAARALINATNYESMYRDSVQNTEAFWAKQARERLTWIKPFTKVKDTSFDAKDLHVRWFADGQLNVSANCLDRHLHKRADQTAILWEPEV